MRTYLAMLLFPVLITLGAAMPFNKELAAEGLLLTWTFSFGR
jgi:hypothetical protein